MGERIGGWMEGWVNVWMEENMNVWMESRLAGGWMEE